ncbi:MAG: hypothetical protein AAF126_02055, partial [Chloroflexota bacterium]
RQYQLAFERKVGNLEQVRLLKRSLIVQFARQEDKLHESIEYHLEAGRFLIAKEIYRLLFQILPSRSNDWHQLSVIEEQLGNHKRAARFRRIGDLCDDIE